MDGRVYIRIILLEACPKKTLFRVAITYKMNIIQKRETQRCLIWK